MMYAIFSNEAIFGVERISEYEDNYTLVVEYEENKEQAKEDGMKFAHLFEKKTDGYDNIYYEYVTSVILS
jgi:hypothetical protein